MNRAGLRDLGFHLGRRLGGASEGAWLATGGDGAPVVLKWFPDAAMARRYSALIPALDSLRARGVPVPEYLHVLPFDGGTLSAQRVLPGRSEDNPSPVVIERMAACIGAQAGICAPGPATGQRWGAFVVGALCAGHDGWCDHGPLRSCGGRAARILSRIVAIGAEADPRLFPDSGLVHLDMHTDNILVENDRLTGIIDWDGACAGDPLYDLVQFAFDLDGHGQPVWEIVDGAGIEPNVLRAYVALLTLKCTSSAILHRPGDVARQLDRAERVFHRYGI